MCQKTTLLKWVLGLESDEVKMFSIYYITVSSDTQQCFGFSTDSQFLYNQQNKSIDMNTIEHLITTSLDINNIYNSDVHHYGKILHLRWGLPFQYSRKVHLVGHVAEWHNLICTWHLTEFVLGAKRSTWCPIKLCAHTFLMDSVMSSVGYKPRELTRY